MSAAKYNMTAAVLGTGYMGRQYIELLREMVSEVIVCSADTAGKELAEKHGLKFYDNYEALFAAEKPTFAAICLPTPLHHPAAMCAFEHGVHVMCEKPFAANSDQAKEMIATAKERGLTLMVGHLLRFVGYYQYLKECIESECFGKLLHLELFRHHAWPTWSVNGWLKDVSKSGGIIKDLHIHYTDIINWIFGIPESVFSTGNDSSCYTIYRYPGDLTVTATGTWRNAGFLPSHGYDAVFERASLRYDFDYFKISGAPASVAFETGNPLKAELEYFCECVKTGAYPEKCPPESCADSLIINEAETKSLHERILVTL